MKLAGLDVGTTGCKCTVFLDTGAMLGRFYREYPRSRSENPHEIDALSILSCVRGVLRETAAVHPDLGGIGVSSFGETFVLTGSDGIPLHPAMLYTDPRGKQECESLVQELGEKEIASITGLRPHEMYSLPKLMWLRRHQPGIAGRAKFCFLMQDFIVFHLTGRRQIDASLAARTMTFDVSLRQWSDTILRAVQIPPELFSSPVPSGTQAGPLLPGEARELGLRENCRIVSVGHDQIAACLGAGAFSSATAVDGAGTVQCVTPLFEGRPDPEQMYRGYYSVVPYLFPDTYAAYAFSYTGGALLRWCVDTLAKQEKLLAAEQGISVHTLLEERYRGRHGDEPGHLLVLPHFAGAATPYMDMGSRGAVIGLSLDDGTEEIYWACMEGIALEMLLNLTEMGSTLPDIRTVHATGGGAASAAWLQMKADVLGYPVTAMETAEAGGLGGAMLAGMALGCFPSLEAAASSMIQEGKTYLPRARYHERYLELFERYRRLYRAVRPLMGGEPV